MSNNFMNTSLEANGLHQALYRHSAPPLLPHHQHKCSPSVCRLRHHHLLITITPTACLPVTSLTFVHIFFPYLPLDHSLILRITQEVYQQATQLSVMPNYKTRKKPLIPLFCLDPSQSTNFTLHIYLRYCRRGPSLPQVSGVVGQILALEMTTNFASLSSSEALNL